MVKSQPLRFVVETIALAIVYVGGARVGLALDPLKGFATLVWPQTGISLAALLLIGYRAWPGVALGAFAVNAWIGAPIPVALGIGAGNTMEALLGAHMIRRWGGYRGSIAGLRPVLGLVLLAALLSAVVSATAGVSSLALGGVVSRREFLDVWRVWWLGDVLGCLVFAPLLLAWAGSRPLQVRPRRLAEAAALAAGLLGVSLFVFFAPPASQAMSFIRASWLVPMLFWAALRFGMRGTTAAIFLVSLMAIWGTALQRGPFVQDTLRGGLLLLQPFLDIAAVNVLVFGALISERSEAIRRREEFLAIVSHDLKNPLNAIQMTTRSLLHQFAGSEVGRRQIAIVDRSVRRMSSLIRDLLDLSAVEGGNLKLRHEEHDAASLMSEAVEMMRPLAAVKSQTLREVPPPEPVPVLCDRERVLQVFSNLVGNAIKFTPGGGSITVSAGSLDHLVRFSVADTGPGIPQEELPHVFERFWKAAGTAREDSHGAGLGLSIARGIVEAHGGTMWAESQVGVGTLFHLTLPVARPRGSFSAARAMTGSWSPGD